MLAYRVKRLVRIEPSGVILALKVKFCIMLTMNRDNQADLAADLLIKLVAFISFLILLLLHSDLLVVHLHLGYLFRQEPSLEYHAGRSQWGSGGETEARLA